MRVTKIIDEHTEQVNYFNMLNKHLALTKDLILAHAIPNGGLRNKVVAKKLKAEGVKSGVPDIFIPIPRNGFHGLYIEMKKTKGWSINQNQKFWLNYLNDKSYYAVVCKGAFEAYDVTMDYLSGDTDNAKRYLLDRSKFNKKDGLNRIYQQSAIDLGYCK